MKVILVDDDPISLATLNSFLKEFSQVQAFCFDNAKDALEELSKKDQTGLLISDINMPNLSGEVLVGKVNELKKGIDIVLVTATPKMNQTLPSYMLGVREVLTKPFDKKFFNEIISSSLMRYKRWRYFFEQIKNQK